MNPDNKGYCLSCDTPLEEAAKYCQSCGQSRRASILSVKELWTNFWTTILNVDNSFFRTLSLIFRPDKLTQMYVAGKRKSYLNPVRLFLILLVLLVATLFLTPSNLGGVDFLPKTYKQYYQSKLYEEFDTKISTYEIGDSTRVALENVSKELFRGMRCPDVDTLYGGFRITDFGNKKNILKQDFVELTEEEIYEKYKIDSYYEKLILRQYLRINKDTKAAMRYLFGNAAWGLIPSILLICLLLKLLYRNQLIEYLEHLILVCNIHSSLFFFAIIASLLGFILPDQFMGDLIGYGILASLIFVFVIFKKYYKEGIIRTAIKFGLFFFTYFFMTVILIALTMVFSGFIYK